MKKGLISAFIVFCLCPHLARADTDPFPANCSIPAPDISGWTVVQTSRVEFRISDETAAYLGLDVEYMRYRNPADPGEFVQIISRHVPGIFSEQRPTDERLFSQAVAIYYTQKDREDFFSEIAKKTDPILYLHWRTKENSRTGRDMKDGDTNIWFLQSSGKCLTAQNERVGVQFVTENVDNGKLRNVSVGVKYQVGDAYHILKIDRRDLLRLRLMKGEK